MHPTKIKIALFLITLNFVFVSFDCLSKERDVVIDRVTVTFFGAKGDGHTDDTRAIQKAINYTFDVKNGGIVIFPAGTYATSEPIIIPRNVNLVGEGIGFSSSILPKKSDAIWIKGNTQEGGFAFRNSIQGLNINMKESPENNAVTIESAYNIKLENIFIYRAGKEGISISMANHVTLDNVIVYGNENRRGCGIKVSNSTVSMYNIDLENNLIGLEIGPDTRNHSHVSVFGGFVERFGKYGINIFNSKHNTFIGLNIRADNKQKIPVAINNDLSSDLKEKNNTFIGGFIGFSEKNTKLTKKTSEYKLSEIANTINVGE